MIIDIIVRGIMDNRIYLTIKYCRYILDARELPIVTCLKKIKDQLMVRFYKKKKEIEEMCGTMIRLQCIYNF
jgi:hypothetical protein